MIWYKKSDKKNVHDRTSTQRGKLRKELKRRLQKNYVDEEKEVGERKEIRGNVEERDGKKNKNPGERERENLSQ